MAWAETKVIARTEWAPHLWTIRLDAKLQPFSPGQFVKLGLDIEGELVRRAYSLASAPGAPPEFYLIAVDGGALTPRLEALGIGDALMINDKPEGFFTMDHVPTARELWLIATGTGLGPFMSMLRSGILWPRFERVILVHGARLATHFGYEDELSALAERRAGMGYVRLCSRERAEDALFGRIPAAIASGHLEAAAGAELSADRSHVMLCGNPEMIRDTTIALEARGLRKHRTRAPGHISTERYW